jgi:tripartite-type tricarboxylate transporter receptor subunit TctC
MWAPKGTSEPIVKKLNEAMVKATQASKVAETLKAQGTTPGTLDAAQTKAFAEAENEKWLRVMKQAGIKAE